MVCQPTVEPVGDALGLRHPADAGFLIHHPVAFGYRELSEQEKPFARCGGDPIGIAATGVKEYRLRGLGTLPGPFDQFIFNLEWAQSLEFFQCEEVSHERCSVVNSSTRSSA